MKKIFFMFLSIAFTTLLFANTDSSYVCINIDKVGYEKLEIIKQSPEIEWWIELEQELLVLVKNENLVALQEKHTCKILPIKVDTNSLYFVQRAHQKDLTIPGIDVLGNAGRTAVIQAQQSSILSIGQCHDSYYDYNITSFGAKEVHASLDVFEANTVLARQSENEDKSSVRSLNFTANSYDDLANAVDKNSWMSTVNTLSSFNRYTHGNEIQQARDWLVGEYKKIGLEVSTVNFKVGSTNAQNVVAVLKGSERPDEFYIVGGHYDSISESPRTAAPGSEDNASGASGVLEMARAFVKHPPKATIVFVNYSGEEQGLVGSYKHVSDLFASGQNDKVKMALIMDMIGYTGDSDLDLLLETGDVGKHLFPVFTQAAKEYTTLRIVTSLRPFGSDHVPFINKGIPSLLTIENDWDDYAPYHTTGDRPSKVNIDMGHQVLRMNVVTLAMMMDN